MNASISCLDNFLDRFLARIDYERQSDPTPDDFKLNNMVELLERLQNPHQNYPIVHVAGTKGKGSVCAFVGAILRQLGLKPGVYASPHLDRIHQRIRLDGNDVSEESLLNVLQILDPIVQAMDAEADKTASRKLTFFELITAAGFVAFSQAAVDVAVLEVGLGGRLDSTNVCQPSVCVITNISLDHVRQLGTTLEAIAAEKAGIIKPGIPVVCGVTDKGPQAVIHAIAEANRAPLFQLGEEFDCRRESHSRSFTYFSINGEKNYDSLQPALPGSHQIQNAALAIAAAEVFSDQQELPLSNQHLRVGLQSAQLPGRCEVLGDGPVAVLDMAHNAASAAALAETLQSDIPQFAQANHKSLLFAASQEKDVDGMLDALLPLFDEVIVTQYQNNPRGRNPLEILDMARTKTHSMALPVNVSHIEQPMAAWDKLISGAKRESAFCITGSAFLVAELRPTIANWASNC